MGQQRGRLTPLPERHKIIEMINQATRNGARKAIACKIIGLSVRTMQRWYHQNSREIFEDARPNAIRPTPKNKLSPEETALILSTCNEE